MRSVNKVILIGNLTRDPEMRSTLGKEHITTFGVATNREWTTKTGTQQRAAEFHEIVCFGRLAEVAEKLLKKGVLVNIEGYLKTRSWDDSAGVKKFRTEIVAESIIVLEKRKDRTVDEVHSDQEAEEELQPSITIENPTAI